MVLLIAIGQYELYHEALADIESDQTLYLAMPAIPYNPNSELFFWS